MRTRVKHLLRILFFNFLVCCVTCSELCSDPLVAFGSGQIEQDKEREQSQHSSMTDNSLPVFDVVVVGAGLAGLTCVWELLQQDAKMQRQSAGEEGGGKGGVLHQGLKVLLVEARERVGGRILSFPDEGVIDLGPAWTWPHHDTALAGLLAEMGLETVPQRNRGEDLISPGGQRIVSRWEQGTSRIGPLGTGSLVDQLLQQVTGNEQDQASGGGGGVQMKLESAVTHVEEHTHEEHGRGVLVRFGGAKGGVEQAWAKAAVVALPPRLAHRLTFSPALPTPVAKVLQATPTWMGDTMKVVAVFKTAFWRSVKLSGAVFVQAGGPLSQIWDNSYLHPVSRVEHHALAGFVLGYACKQLSGVNAAEVRRAVLTQLVEVFGSQAESELQHIQYTNWLDEQWTTAQDDGKGAQTRGFGDPSLRRPLFEGCLIFAGTETEQEQGHMEGAVRSGQRAAKQAFAMCGHS